MSIKTKQWQKDGGMEKHVFTKRQAFEILFSWYLPIRLNYEMLNV